MDIVRSALVPYPAARVYALIEDAERYPEYLPWCTRVEIFERDAARIRARLWFGFRELASHLDTEALRAPPERLDLLLSGWPFDGFRASWRIQPLGEVGCKVEFRASTGFRDSRWAELLLAAGGFIADRVMAAFLRRAGEVLADPAAAPAPPLNR
jgi:ribosome-associated toxin RatA of RatAB toxin-antitoxin module